MPGSGKAEFRQKNGALVQAKVTREGLSDGLSHHVSCLPYPDCPIFDGFVKSQKMYFLLFRRKPGT
jgi:hypothetical protein